MIHEMQSNELVYVREPSSGRVFRVLAIATQADANAYMARHSDTGVVFATDDVAYIAHLNDSGWCLKGG